MQRYASIHRRHKAANLFSQLRFRQIRGILSMNFSRHASAILLGFGILAGAGGGAAWSQEELVMPYACDARGGGVRLYPAPQQSYRIYGKREKWLFRYCSPNAPDRCHHWMLHQFDVDCGGMRVPWIRVAEASSPDGRAWVEDGRMTLKLGSAEASPREERMARRRWWRHRGAYPADERERFDGPSGPHSEMVELPAGFAPVLGTRAQFLGVPPGEMSSEPEERGSDIATVVPAKPPAPAPQKREATPAAQPKEAPAQAIKPPAPTPAKRETAKAAETAPAAEKSVPKADAAQKSEPAPQAKPEKAATPAPKAETATGTAIAPTIINKQGAPAQPSPAPAALPPDMGTATVGEATSTSSASATQAQVSAASSPAATATAEPPAQVAPDGGSPIATGSLRDQGAHERPPSLLQAQTLTIGFVLFGVLAASSFVFWSRRQERARLGTLVRRDIASVTFGGEPHAASSPAPLAPHIPQALPDSMGAGQAGPSEIGIEMPATPQEALQVLGASPDASIDVIKKIVDGLRQSWHPDLAKSEDDRLYREQRVKQINVAWDILSGRRSAA
jgi:hypothetical protein